MYKKRHEHSSCLYLNENYLLITNFFVSLEPFTSKVTEYIPEERFVVLMFTE